VSEYDPTDVQAQEAARQSQDRERKLSKDTEESDFKWLMGQKRGRRIVWRLLERAGAFRSVFNTNAMSMSFAEGHRNYGLHVIGLIHTLCPELYPVMVKENANEQRNSDDDGSRNNH
jgi:hypothetical protein